LIKNEPKLQSATAQGLHPVDDSASGPAEETGPAALHLPSKRGLRIIADLESELRRNGLEPDLIDTNVVLLPRRFFLFPRIHPDDDEHRYMRRVRVRSGLMTIWVGLVAVFITAAIGSMIFTANELYVEPRAQAAHTRLLESELMEIIDNTRIGIDPVNPSVPDWMWASFSPDWYIEDAVYTRSLDQSDRNVELLSFLREKKAVVVREIEPAYSNDKVQNRLRDPSIIYFGSEYQRAYRRFVNMVLTVAAIAREDNATPGLDSVFTSKRRAELIEMITEPRPPEPNPYYDNRVEAMVDNLAREVPLVGDGAGALVDASADDHGELLAMLDDIYRGADDAAFDSLSDGGLGPLLQRLPSGWGSTNLTRAFYETRRARFVDWNVLELRLLMLDLLYGAEKLPQELPLIHLYLMHLGGEGYHALYTEIARAELMAEAVDWIEADVAEDGNPATREERFIEAFGDNERLELGEDDDPSARRVALALLFKAARFEYTYAIVEAAENDLEARPFMGRMGLPVRDLDVEDIRPWGLYGARRNGYAHQGLDIAGELGEPAIAVMDGTIIRAGYQRGGAGNYLVLSQGNLQVTYMHLLKEPSRSNFKRLLTREELAEFGNDARRGYDRALRRYASIVLGRNMDSLTDEDLDLSRLREASLFDRALRALRRGETPTVRKGDPIANVGVSGNVTQNSARPEMIYPHIHLEINGGRIDPMQVIDGIGSRWFEIRDHHLSNPFYRNWLKQSHNWNWYGKFYRSATGDAESG